MIQRNIFHVGSMVMMAQIVDLLLWLVQPLWGALATLCMVHMIHLLVQMDLL